MSSSVTLPTHELPTHELPELESGQGHFDLLSHLLAEQKEMTAVEQFSHWHESAPPANRGYQSLLPTSAPPPGQQYAFEVDLDACSGCKACVVACHTLNGLDEQETWRKVGLLNSTTATLPIVQHVTTACHHCVDPGCLKGCPVLAYEKDPSTGIVRHLDDQCFGCKYCLMMCPYEVPQYNASLGIVRKCDMCAGRLGQGEAPACVQACPNQAIKISLVNVDAIRSYNATDVIGNRLLSTAPLDRLTQPTTQFVSKRISNTRLPNELVSRESVAIEVQPGHEPLVVMLVLTQASVGVWCVLAATLILEFWPASSVIAASVAATLLGFVGVQAALLHLGRPWLAFRSILGWRRSWLSREAIAFGLYLGAAFSATASCLFNGLHFLAPLTSVAAAALGCIAVFCSVMIYVATRRELWSPTRTLLEFAATTMGLGLAIASLFTIGMPAAVMLIGGAVVCTIAYIPKWMDWRAASKEDLAWHDFSGRSGRMMRNELRNIVCAAVACIVLAGCLAVAMPIAAVIALVASQLIARWLYFASVVFARMPGATT